MTTRRSRPSRSRKPQAPPPVPRHDDVLVESAAATYPSDLPPMPPSLADELALLDAGWDSA